jgi:hypothetical protein
MTITSMNVNTVSFDKLAEVYPTRQMGTGTSALKGSMGTHEMVQTELQEMMRELTPHLGQNIDVEA